MSYNWKKNHIRNASFLLQSDKKEGLPKWAIVCAKCSSAESEDILLNDREMEKVLCRFWRPAFVLHAAESVSHLPCFSRRLKLQEKSLSTHQTRCCSGRPCSWACLGSVYPATAHTSWPRRRGFPCASEPRWAGTRGKVCRCRRAARLLRYRGAGDETLRSPGFYMPS